MVDGDLTCRQMARLFDLLDDHYELSDAYKTENEGIPPERWDRTEREHMAGWFRANTGRGWGQYSRQRGNNSARRCYNRLQSSNGLIWIAEAVGIDAGMVREASRVALAEPDHRRRCAAIRKIIPWSLVCGRALTMIEDFGIR